MIYAQPRIRPRKRDAQNSFAFWDTNGSSNLGHTTRPSDSQKKKKQKKKNRTGWFVHFAFTADHRVKLKAKRLISTLTLLENWKTMEYESDGDTSCYWRAPYSHQRICTGTVGLGNKRTSGDHPNYSIVEIGQNTKKSLGDFRRLPVTQTPEENHQIKLMWKNSQMSKVVIILRRVLEIWENLLTPWLQWKIIS